MFDTNPTQIAGVLAFAASTAACVVAARRACAPARASTAKAWKLLALLHGAFVAEIVFGVRHEVHSLADAFLIDGGWYGQRQTAQQALLGLALLVGALGLWAVVRWGRAHRSVRPAALASFAVAALFALEMISLHAIDAVLYLRLGPLMLIALLWAACAATVVGTAIKR